MLFQRMRIYITHILQCHDDTSILDKFILHGYQTYQYTDGGSAAHINLEDHLSKRAVSEN